MQPATNLFRGITLLQKTFKQPASILLLRSLNRIHTGISFRFTFTRTETTIKCESTMFQNFLPVYYSRDFNAEIHR